MARHPPGLNGEGTSGSAARGHAAIADGRVTEITAVVGPAELALVNLPGTV